MTSRARFLPATAVVLAVVLSGCGTQSATDEKSTASEQPDLTGCGSVAPIVESTQYTAYDNRHHVAPSDATLEKIDVELLKRPPFRPAIDGLDAQGMLVAAGQIHIYYAETPPPEGDPGDVVANGGLVLQFMPVPSGNWGTAPAIAELGERAVPVEVGDYDGILTWGDPDEDGARAHYLMWGKDNESWRIVGVREPEELVKLARDLVC